MGESISSTATLTFSMPLFWTDPDYLLMLGVWLILLGLALAGLLALRRRWRRRGGLTRGRTIGLGLALAVWSVLATITAFEVAFVCFVDHSDAFNGTNVSKRWFQRYIDAQRNEDGFRDRRTLATLAPPGSTAKRIVVFGDSYVAGHGIKRMDDRFTERLERAFNADGVDRVRVLNMGDPGYEISMIEAMMQAAIEMKHPIDVMIYCYMMNDIEGYDPRTEEFLRAINTRQPTNPLITRTYFPNWVYFRWEQIRANAAVDYFPHLIDSYETRAWDAVAASLTRIRDRCRAAGIEFRLVVFPFMQDLGPDSPFKNAHAKLASWAREHDVPFLDMEPVLSAHRHERIRVNAFDSHPNEYAHRLIAEALYEWLKADPQFTRMDGSSGDEH
jgi:lysophospholipase L1-like esterase